MKNVSDSLAGRAGIIRMMGLSMRELDGISYRHPFLPALEHIAEREKEGMNFDYSK